MSESATSDSEIPTAIWDQAVLEIDAERGFTVEFAADPDYHRALYAQRAAEIADNVSEEL